MNSEDEKMEDMSKAELRKKLKEIDPGLKDSVISKWDMKTLEKEYNKRLKKKDEKEKMALYHLEETVKVMEEIKPAEKPKEMSLTDRIQDLPFDLQDLIFKKLPTNLKKEVEEGTPAEKDAKFLKDNPFDFFEDNYRMKGQLVGWDLGPTFGKDAGAIFKFDWKRIMDGLVTRLKEYGGVRAVKVEKIGRPIIVKGKQVKVGGYNKYEYNYAIYMDTPLHTYDENNEKSKRTISMSFLLDKNGNPIIPITFDGKELKGILPYLKHFQLDKKEVEKWNKISETREFTDAQLDYQNYFSKEKKESDSEILDQLEYLRNDLFLTIFNCILNSLIISLYITNFILYLIYKLLVI
jgi:hypothetical protein